MKLHYSTEENRERNLTTRSKWSWIVPRKKIEKDIWQQDASETELLHEENRERNLTTRS